MAKQTHTTTSCFFQYFASGTLGNQQVNQYMYMYGTKTIAAKVTRNLDNGWKKRHQITKAG